MNTLESAIRLAIMAHNGQVDKNGEPYILHVLRVMLDCQQFCSESDNTMMVAVLHDIVEDTEITLPMIEAEFGAYIAGEVDNLTKREDEKHTDYIERTDNSRLSRRVKMADIRDNMDPRRVTSEHGMYARYAKAYRRLKLGPMP